MVGSQRIYSSNIFIEDEVRCIEPEGTALEVFEITEYCVFHAPEDEMDSFVLFAISNGLKNSKEKLVCP